MKVSGFLLGIIDGIFYGIPMPIDFRYRCCLFTDSGNQSDIDASLSSYVR
jgi:hypothetical protein